MRSAQSVLSFVTSSCAHTLDNYCRLLNLRRLVYIQLAGMLIGRIFRVNSRECGNFEKTPYPKRDTGNRSN